MSNIIINENRDNILKVVANDFAISRNAKGMMLDLLFMNNNASIKALVERSADGQHKVTTALKELEKNGYLVRQRIRTSGKWSDYNYVLTIPQVEETMFVRETTSKTNDLFLESLDAPILNAVNPIVENRNMVKPKAESFSMDDFDIEESPYTENRDAVDDDIYTSIYNQDIDMIDNNINKSYIDISYHNHIINPISSSGTTDKVKSQLDYDSLISTNADDKDLIDMIINIVSKSFEDSSKWGRISGRCVSMKNIQSMFSMLDKLDVQYVLDCIKRSAKEIRSIKPYLRTSLYNAVANKHNRNIASKYSYGKKKKSKVSQVACDTKDSTISMDRYYQLGDMVDKELEMYADGNYS